MKRDTSGPAKQVAAHPGVGGDSGGRRRRHYKEAWVAMHSRSVMQVRETGDK